MPLDSYEICWGKMPLVVMKYIGAKYGNKNVKMIFYMIWGGKMPLCSDEIYWGKIATTNPPLRPLTTNIYIFTEYNE